VLPLIGSFVDIGSGRGTADEHWERAFRAGIRAALRPFFVAIGPERPRPRTLEDEEDNDDRGDIELPDVPAATADSGYVSPPPWMPPAPSGPQPPASSPPRDAPPATIMPSPFESAPQAPPPLRACDERRWDDCIAEAQRLAGGSATEQQAAARALDQACAADVVLACARLAPLVFNGTGTARNPERAFSLATRGCSAGDAEACSLLGIQLERGLGTRQDPVAAARAHLLACDKGRGTSCRALGKMYESGQGVPVDKARAATLFKRACDLKVKAPGCEGEGATP
jgi:hypothetical protein